MVSNFNKNLRKLLLLIALILFISEKATGQLKELEITQIVQTGIPPLFKDHISMAAIEIRSSLTNLKFESTWGIVEQKGEPEAGRYILIIEPKRQVLTITAQGFMQKRLPLQITSPRTVEFYSIEPKNNTNTEFGTLIVKTIPDGASLKLDGVPGEFKSDFTFDSLLAQSYILRVSLDDFETEERLVTVTSQKPAVETINLIPSYGFLVIETQGDRLFLNDDDNESEYRVEFKPETPIRLDNGNYTYRITRENYEDATGSFEIEPNKTVRLNPNQEAKFGLLNLNVNVLDAELYVTPKGSLLESKIDITNKSEPSLPPGVYLYRLTSKYYIEEKGEFEITRENRTELNVSLKPAFGTLKINANTNKVRLRASNNEAPNSFINNIIYLEKGKKTVFVEADGYTSVKLEVQVEPGMMIEEVVRLETLNEQRDRLAREALPKGVLEITADLDAEIYVNGVKRGTGEIALALTPGLYDVQLRHPSKSKKLKVSVPPAGIYSELVFLKPSRRAAITRSVLFPGLGQIYTKQQRGYAYMATIAGSGFYTYMQLQKQRELQSEIDDLSIMYKSATSTIEADGLRKELMDRYSKASNAHSLKSNVIYMIGGVYLLQVLDLMIIEPKFGYRDTNKSAIQASIKTGKVSLKIAFN